MLASLSIRDVVLIDRLDIDFKAGFLALTGETGAGKSIFLDAMGLALGARSETGLIRKGADQAAVTASFDIENDHPAYEILKESDILGAEGDLLILRRIVQQDGKSRAFINDHPVSIGLLRQIGETLVEIHGQFESQGLLNPAFHRQLLDHYIGAEESKITQAWTSWKDAEKELEQLKSDAEKSRTEENYLRQALEDLDTLNPQAGEEKELDITREYLMHQEKIIQNLVTAYNILNKEEDPISRATTSVSRVANILGESGAQILEALERATTGVQEALSIIQSLCTSLEEGDHNLEDIDERLYQLRTQARKHNCTVDELLVIRERLANQLNLIERSDDILAAQMKKVQTARKAYETEAEKLSTIRQKSAKKIDTLVGKELTPLKMEKAKFITSVEKLPEPEWGPQGWDRVRFLVSTNPGNAPGPVHKIVSGGELSRLMLALKVVLTNAGSDKITIVFDEVDAGTGGAVAHAIGERLARLAKNGQVLTVTHAPQVAARADAHWIVQKGGLKNVRTVIVPLKTNAERQEEIARMLAGAKITKEARAAASKLLETGT